MTDKPTADDYRWITEQHEDWVDAYCVTYVGTIAPGELLRALGADPAERITGVSRLAELTLAHDEDDQRFFVGATAVGDWSVMVEHNGFLGATDEAVGPLSRGRTVVSHYRNANALHRFCWYVDGTLRLDFDALFADSREGSAPDGLLADMAECGFDLTGEDDTPAHWAHTTVHPSFALAERLTGIRLTPQTLTAAPYLCGLSANPWEASGVPWGAAPS
ncbi:DUF6461 domain-containing protein [Streptomyces sp. NPDC018026]|uniref:DUF6461 domain-containing protein n=1 Tax=Streptomyces sp. NPDC018026 TaxID=3365031 RepID=UPI0037BA39D5